MRFRQSISSIAGFKPQQCGVITISWRADMSLYVWWRLLGQKSRQDGWLLEVEPVNMLTDEVEGPSPSLRKGFLWTASVWKENCTERIWVTCATRSTRWRQHVKIAGQLFRPYADKSVTEPESDLPSHGTELQKMIDGKTEAKHRRALKPQHWVKSLGVVTRGASKQSRFILSTQSNAIAPATIAFLPSCRHE